MIEVIKEMCEAAWDALPVDAQHAGDIDLDDMAVVLAAALNIVERDRVFAEPAPEATASLPECTCPLGPEDAHFSDCPMW